MYKTVPKTVFPRHTCEFFSSYLRKQVSIPRIPAFAGMTVG